MSKGCLTGDFVRDQAFLDKLTVVDTNFDVLRRNMIVGEKHACFYFIDGFCKDEILEKLMEFLYKVAADQVPDNMDAFVLRHLPYGETDLLTGADEILKFLLSGVPILLIEGYKQCVAIDCRTYPGRSVDEPEKDKVMRGSRDGFVETLVFNTALVRRRIRSNELVMEMHTVGRTSRTDVVISYMKDRVDPKMLKDIVERIDAIQIDSLTMNQESLAECLYQHKWFNPFPKFKFTERPDTTAACLLEGNVVLLVDNSPSAMILPTSVFDIVEDADDYYFPPITGTYLRLSRLVINLAAVFFTPVFLLLMMHQEWIPEWLSFIQIKDTVNIPFVWQFLILEFAIDGLRLASLNTPNMLSTPLSVVAGIVLGDYTVSSGWFNSQVMLYMAFVAVANYTQTSLELGYALKFLRITLLILTAVFGVYGFFAGIVIGILALVFNRTIVGKSYLSPLFPFRFKQCIRRFLRVSLPSTEK